MNALADRMAVGVSRDKLELDETYHLGLHETLYNDVYSRILVHQKELNGCGRYMIGQVWYILLAQWRCMVIYLVK
jgi:hypothetical protein